MTWKNESRRHSMAAKGIKTSQFSNPTPKKEFLNFIYKRMENVHGENPNVDYMHRLKEIIESEPTFDIHINDVKGVLIKELKANAQESIQEEDYETARQYMNAYNDIQKANNMSDIDMALMKQGMIDNEGEAGCWALRLLMR